LSRNDVSSIAASQLGHTPFAIASLRSFINSATLVIPIPPAIVNERVKYPNLLNRVALCIPHHRDIGPLSSRQPIEIKENAVGVFAVRINL
jgi:hypothetical protein